MKQRRELQRLLRSLHEIGTHRQLVSVFSSPPDDDSSVETKARVRGTARVRVGVRVRVRVRSGSGFGYYSP